MINYIGKQDKIEEIDIAPVILKKGVTQLCLYSLGSMRDERLSRMWNNKKVRFLRPQQDIDHASHKDDDDDDEEEDDDSNVGFFNLFALHQNRDFGRGSKNCVKETMIPEWMDLVVWGHEHECVIELSESLLGTFRITQPGSSVATSLVPGEAARKKVGILDIMGKQFRMNSVPLTQVRPFVTAELSLQEHREGLDPEDPHVDEHVTAVLQEEVKVMVCSAQDKRQEILVQARNYGNDAGDDDSPLMHKLEKPGEPLVRIRVEHTGFSTLSNQRFGAHFVGQVANPEDILLFHRRKDPSKAAATRKAKVTSGPIAPEVLEKTDMDDLINGLLEGPDTQLKLFNEKLLAEAMENFVEKKIATSLDDMADGMLNKRQKSLFMRKMDADEEDQKQQEQENPNDSMANQSMESEKGARSKSQSNARRQENTSMDDSFIEAEAGDHDGPSDDESVDDVTNRAKSSNRQTKKRGRDSDETEKTTAPKHASKPSKAKPSKTKNGAWVDSQLSFVGDTKRKAARRKALDDLSDVEEIDLNAPSKTKSTRRNTRGKRVNYSIDNEDDDAVNSDEDPEVVSIVDDEDDDELLDDDSDGPGRGGKKRKAVPAASRSKAQKPPAKKTAPRKKSRATAREKFDDSDDDVSKGDFNNSMDLDEDWGTAKTRSQF